MKPLVSIIIPSFNSQKWLGWTIRSAINQTWKNKEVIIIDDGSKDQTWNLARGFSSPQVKVFRQENQGASAARNAGLGVAQGDFIQWLDSDDLLAPDKIERQICAATCESNNNILLSSGWGVFLHRPGKARIMSSSLWQDQTPVQWLSRKLEENAWMCIESWIVSRSLTDKAGPWNEDLSLDDDGEYFGRMMTFAEGVRFVPGVTSFCRGGNAGSLSSMVNLSDRKLESQFKSIESNVRYLLSMKESEETRAACNKLLSRWAPAFYYKCPELFSRLKDLAGKIGGNLEEPVIGWKIGISSSVFGWRATWRMQKIFRNLKCIPANNMERLSLWFSGGDPLIDLS